MSHHCEYFKCRHKAHWVVETSYSPVLLCHQHIGIKFLSLAAKVKSISKGIESDVRD